MMMEATEGFVIPVGFKFLPTEEQLLSHFLYKKVMREISPVDSLFIKECDIYGDKEPWEIWDEHGGRELEEGQDLYLFTQLKHLTEKNGGSRKRRRVGGGSWEGENTASIYNNSTSPSKNNINSKVELGFKKRFSYETGSKSKKKEEDKSMAAAKRWILLEFSLNPNMLPPSSYPNDYAVCLLRKPVTCKKRKKLSRRDADKYNYLEKEVQEIQDGTDQGRAKRLVQEISDIPSSLLGDDQQLSVAGDQEQQQQQQGISACCDDLLLSNYGAGGSTGVNDSPPASSSAAANYLVDDFLDDTPFQDFGSVEDAFPHLFGPS